MGFNLYLIVFLVGGWAAARLAHWLRLPSVLGMLLFGVVLGTGIVGPTPRLLGELEPFLKSVALIVILLRAGLGIRRATLARVGMTAALMSFVPGVLEIATAAWLYHLVFGLDLYPAIIGASILGAVSPAVVVPSMLDLKNRGYGAQREVPTIILAGASVDDVVAITIFTSVLALVVGVPGGTSGIPGVAMPVPVSIVVAIIGGIVVGLALGFALARFFARFHERIRATEKTLLLLMVALLVVEVGNVAHIAALLAVMVVGFVLLETNERVAHELASKLAKVWVLAEIVLFVLIGMAVDIPVALEAGARGLIVIAGGLIARSVGVVLATVVNRDLTRGERLFCVIAYLPKATVQAALGTVPLAMGVSGGPEILAVSVLSIAVTAPVGLALIRGLGPRLLGVEGERGG